MTTSLPKIKLISQSNQNVTQKQLKFKKLKLSTDSSAADIRQRFKSVRTQRLSSLQRYSTVEGQRQQKKQKIHLNLLQRKLLTGTYDQAQQTGNDLNQLKQKTDNYRILATQKHAQTQKLKQLTLQIKKQIQKYDIERKARQQAVQKIQKKYDQQRIKTQTFGFERSSLQYMISQRKTINHFLQSRINQDKNYLTKLKVIVKQVQNQARQSTQQMKNLQLSITKLNNQMLRQQRNREQIMYQKQYVISKRKQGDKFRVQKSNQFKKNLDEVEQQLQKKDFMEYFNAILGNIFLSKFLQANKSILQQKYQVMYNSYSKICTYNKFNKEIPIKMIDRLKQLKPQTQQFEKKIKKLQQIQLKLQQKNKNLQRRYSESILIAKLPITSSDIKRVPVSKEINEQFLQQQQKQKDKKIQKIKTQIINAHELLFKIQKWSQRYAHEFQLKYKRSGKSEQIGKNINNILKCIQKDHKELKEKNVYKLMGSKKQIS